MLKRYLVAGMALVTLAGCGKSVPAAVEREAEQFYTTNIKRQWQDSRRTWTYCQRGSAWMALTTESGDGRWFKLEPSGNGQFRVVAYGDRDPALRNRSRGGDVQLCDGSSP